jgi:hypothetical protein
MSGLHFFILNRFAAVLFICALRSSLFGDFEAEADISLFLLKMPYFGLSFPSNSAFEALCGIKFLFFYSLPSCSLGDSLSSAT